MFLVVTYDVAAERTEIYRKYLIRFLTHEQNSVFAGDLAESRYRKMRVGLSQRAIPGDRVLVFRTANKHNMEVVRLEKNKGNGAYEETPVLQHSMNAMIL